MDMLRGDNYTMGAKRQPVRFSKAAMPKTWDCAKMVAKRSIARDSQHQSWSLGMKGNLQQSQSQVAMNLGLELDFNVEIEF
jgi:hypothetical protein